ncbi:Protein of unknown function [Bacillus mycoides]|nr:Protein of unknown function [Bacillus mycoides]SCM90152.1 Protein of unknown function [Bacillus mycoides]
MLLSSMILEG